MDDIRDQVHTMRLFLVGWSDRGPAGRTLGDILSKAIDEADAAIDAGRRDEAVGYTRAAQLLAGQVVRDGDAPFEITRPPGADELMTEETADALRGMLHDYWLADEPLLVERSRNRLERRAQAGLLLARRIEALLEEHEGEPMPEDEED